MNEKPEGQNKKAQFYGKVARLPKDTDAKKFLENIKIPKNDLWYVLVEKQDNELHMVKYNQEGVNANQFVAELKMHYLKHFENKEKIKKLIDQIQVVGNDNFSIIKNVPDVKIGDKKLVTRITEDLIKLLKK